MQEYLDLITKITTEGKYKEDRTGTGTYSIFGAQMRFNLSEGFPLLTTKHTHIKPIIHELLWFLKGETNIRYLKENGVNIWDQWVLDGTEEYRPMTEDEVKAAIVKAYEKINKEAKYRYSFINLPEDDPVFNSVMKTESDLTVIIEHKGIQGLNELYSDLHQNKEPKVLIAGELGPVYGSQWRSWPKVEFTETELSKASGGVQGGSDVKFTAIDQITNVVEMIKKNPDSRRLIVSAWNPAEVDNMALPPCHTLFQFYSTPLWKHEIVKELNKRNLTAKFIEDITHDNDPDSYSDWLSGKENQGVTDWVTKYLEHFNVPSRKLSCQLYQRSADTFIGLPYNIASYSILTMMIAQVTNHAPGDFVWTGGDCHLYANHTEQTKLMLSRESYPLPTMTLNPEVKDIFDFKYEDFTLTNYKSNPHIPAPVAV